MHTRSLGRTDLRLSEIALGTWGLADESYGPVPIERFDETVRVAIERGITTFDCAPLWGDGDSERVVGRWIEESDVDAVVITRGGVRRIDGRVRQGFSPDELIADCDASLERLGREQIDVWLLHNPGDEVLRREEWREAIDKLEEAGKIRAWGVSVGDVDEARVAMSAGAQALCLTHNLLYRRDLDDLTADIAKAGCGILARSPLAYGLLAGHWSESRLFATGDHRGRRWNQNAFSERIRQVNELRFLVGPHSPDLATAAMRFVLTQASVTSVIVGARTPYQVSAAAEAASGVPYLTDDDVMRLAKIRDHKGY